MFKILVIFVSFCEIFTAKIYFSNVSTSFDPKYATFMSVIGKEGLTMNGTINSFHDLSKMTVNHAACTIKVIH